MSSPPPAKVPRTDGDVDVKGQDKGSIPLYEPHHLPTWLKENEESFKPPVCNKLMYGEGQLKAHKSDWTPQYTITPIPIFLTSGNQRADYHIEEGEELFYMVKGDMNLKVMEKGVPKDVIIKEGELFCLPRKIPHSPQRLQQDSMGLVIERERTKDEMDSLRYYTADQKEILYEKWFHCEDLGTQLGPVIKAFFASKQHETGVPIPEELNPNPPFELDTTTTLHEPFSLEGWLKDKSLNHEGTYIFSKGETKLKCFGEGKTQKAGHDLETYLWQYKKGATVHIYKDGENQEPMKTVVLEEGSHYVVKKNFSFTVEREAGSVGMELRMVPKD